MVASARALMLGVWGLACSSSGGAPENNSSATGPATGGDAALATATSTGGTLTTTTGATNTAGQATTVAATSAVTGATGATGVTSNPDTAGATSVAGGTGTTSLTGGSATTGTTGASTMGIMGTTGGVATSGAATTTANPDQGTCAARPVLSVPSLVDFETYDGATVALDWGFSFNDDGSGSQVLYGGFFDNSDGSGAPGLRMVGGDTSTWAVSASNSEASVWGGGIGMWLGCMNATSYTGISLAVRGSTPNQNGVSVAISVDGLTGGVGTTITVTDLLQTFELPFTAFTNDALETTNGDNIVGLAINAQMLWVQDTTTLEWSPIPGAYEIVIDDIKFY